MTSLEILYSKRVDASNDLFRKLNACVFYSFLRPDTLLTRRLSSLLAMTLQVRVCMYLYNATLCRLLLVDSDFPWDTKLSLDPFAKRSAPNPLSYIAHLKLFLRTAHEGVMLHIEGLEISRHFASLSPRLFRLSFIHVSDADDRCDLGDGISPPSPPLLC